MSILSASNSFQRRSLHHLSAAGTSVEPPSVQESFLIPSRNLPRFNLTVAPCPVPCSHPKQLISFLLKAALQASVRACMCLHVHPQLLPHVQGCMSHMCLCMCIQMLTVGWLAGPEGAAAAGLSGQLGNQRISRFPIMLGPQLSGTSPLRLQRRGFVLALLPPALQKHLGVCQTPQAV